VKNTCRGAVSFFLLTLLVSLLPADEGMYPISDILKLNLRARGLKIDPREVYNPDGASLIDAIVQVGGCTGSFVSPDGLILTNHHCAFGAVQAVSSTEKDYVANGFLARTRSEELPARGYAVRITESYRDVSAEVLGALKEGMDLAERTRTIERRIKEIVADAERQHRGKRAEVSEMFTGRTYVLFLYTYLRDVRLVYVPPRSIGEFGGEHDNWIWPRHTGDFSFLRAYVGPDGSPREYAEENVPFRPRRHLTVQPSGVDEGDFVFILGYPGRTYRHRTSHYLNYEQHYRMPYVASLFEWQISVMEEMGKDDRGVALQHAARIKGLANTAKNYRGKLRGLQRLGLVERKREEEAELQKFIDADPHRKKLYGSMLKDIAAVYDAMAERAESEMILSFLTSSSTMLANAVRVYESAQELKKPDLERETAYMDRNLPRLKENIRRGLENFHEPTDKIFLREILLQAAALPADQRIGAIDALLVSEDRERDIDRFIDLAYETTAMKDAETVLSLLGSDPETVAASPDPFLRLAVALSPALAEQREVNQRRQGALSSLYAQFVEVKQDFLKADFIPDANGTLRLTFGAIRGYSPADATYYSPITTLTGVLEKSTRTEPFDAPQRLVALARGKTYGRFEHPRLKDVPVGILYDMDTTGGNSGSPVLNGRGELVGVNFDRAWEATINDYAWSASYSRSIAVDIRYVLWVTQYIGEAPHLLTEMGIGE
jgi:hypothetical protein